MDDIGTCKCGDIATVLATYEDDSVEPMCEKCYHTAKQEANKTDEARTYLKTILSAEYDLYIDTKLAGDFAVQVADELRSCRERICKLQKKEWDRRTRNHSGGTWSV